MIKILPRGSRQIIPLLPVFALVWVTGCSQAVLVELWNTSKTSISVTDFKHGRVTIESGATTLVDPGMRLRIYRGNEITTYDLRSIPTEYIRSERKKLIVHLIFDDEGLVYLGKKEGDQAMTRVDPQPPTFPLKPNAGQN